MQTIESKLVLVFSLAIGLATLHVSSVPIAELSNESPASVLESDESAENTTTNSTKKDLYVIKAVVYEIGILTEVDENSTDEAYSYVGSNQYQYTQISFLTTDLFAYIFRHERVDLTFYDAHSNGSHFDLGEIPLPVQTNISGQVLTGIAPIHIGAIQNASDILTTLPLTGTIINITHSDTSFINLSHKPSISENGTILNIHDIAKIPGLNGTNAILIDNTPREYENASEEANSSNSDERVAGFNKV